MGKLYRPHIPLSVRCEVAGHQLMRGVVVVSFASAPERPLQARLDWMLKKLSEALGCDVRDLRLDHDPPLGARPKHRRGLGKKTYYLPDANDPDHLLYRPHGPEHEGSHLIKTNVRGDHGQHPDRVLIKKQRKLEKPVRAKNGHRFSTSRKTPNEQGPQRGPKIRSAGFRSSTDKSMPKPKWAKRPFQKRRGP